MKTLSNYFALGTRMTFKKGDYISTSDEGGSTKAIYLLASGTCALLSSSFSGREKVYAYHSGPKVINFAPLLHHQLVKTDVFWSSFSIQARTVCEVYRVSHQVFKNLLTDNDFLKIVTQTLTENNINLIQHFKSLMDEPVALRYCRFLLEHSKLINGRYELPKFFKYQEIADYLAIHPVTVAKLTKTLAIQNILSKSGQQIIIRDHQALTRLLADQADFDY